ncbi:MAG: hypothetical protein KC583_12850 [Myxococcales bacterium]|nr:hypothetical protein [Myxococcales bacterium]
MRGLLLGAAFRVGALGCETPDPILPPGECDDAGVCQPCVDVGVPLDELVYVVIEDRSEHAVMPDGHAGSDLCSVVLRCEREAVIPDEVRWNRGEGLVCDGEQAEGPCRRGVVRTNPSAVELRTHRCTGLEPDREADGPRVLSLGVGGSLLLRYPRTVVDCSLTVGEWEAGPDRYVVTYCTAPPERGGACTDLGDGAAYEGSRHHVLYDPTTTCPP